jgi:hypothetical protein
MNAEIDSSELTRRLGVAELIARAVFNAPGSGTTVKGGATQRASDRKR